MNRAYLAGPDEGEAIWFAGALMLLKADGEQTQGRFTLIDQIAPPGYTVPRHIHHSEDEAWYVLEGEVTLYCGDQVLTAAKGSWAFAPRDVPHSFKAGPDGARLLTFTAPAGFDDFVREAGEPAQTLTPPPPAEMDVENLSTIAAKYGIQIVGPPPA
jgi:quercetin dioxygenase-like cupin family protein